MYLEETSDSLGTIDRVETLCLKEPNDTCDEELFADTDDEASITVVETTEYDQFAANIFPGQ